MLSPNEFAELVAIIKTTHEDDSGPKSEVRRAQRLTHFCMVSITLGTDHEPGPAIKVPVRDISARGMSFFHESPLQRGSQLVLKMEDPTGGMISILAMVVHCQELDKGSYQVGAEFTCVLHPKPATVSEPQAIEEYMRIKSSILD